MSSPILRRPTRRPASASQRLSGVLRVMTVAVLLPTFIGLSWLGLAASRTLPPLTRDALEAFVILAPPALARPPHENAAPMIWTIAYASSDAERAEILRNDMLLVSSEQLFGAEGDTGIKIGFDQNVDHAPDWPYDHDGPCAMIDSHCIHGVLAGGQALREAFAAQSIRLANFRELHRFSYIEVPGIAPVAWQREISPAYTLSLIDAAMQHVDGDSRAALTTLCADAAAIRRLMPRAGDMVSAAVARGYLARAAVLYAGIVQEMPPALSVPSACRAAFGPLRDEELDLCDAMRGEYAWQVGKQASLKQSAPDPDPDRKATVGIVRRIGIDEPHTHSRLARLTTRLCASRNEAAIRGRHPLPTAPLIEPCTPLERAFNVFGCMVTELDGGAEFDRYYTRIIDLDALMRGVSIATWLRDQPVPVAEAFAERPREWRDPNDAVTLDVERSVLRVRQRVPMGKSPDIIELPVKRANASR